jgi:hypothetical protein
MTLNIITGGNGTDFSGGNSQAAQRDQMNNRDQHDGMAESGRLSSGVHLALPPQLLAGLLLLAGLAPRPVCAQPDAAKAAPPSHRCLLIVETSKSMQRRTNAVHGAVQELLASGLNGQLQAGDTLGVWTFNEDLYAGRFPLQTWSPQAQEDITLRTLTFLGAQRYEKQASFDKVLPALGHVIRDSELITVVLITSGDDKIQGTPFDDRINKYYQQSREQQKKKRMPFVTVLRAKDGQLAECVVNTPPWPLRMPLLTPEMRIAEPAQSDFPEAVRRTPTPAVPPLVTLETKPLAEQTPAPKSESAAAKVEAPPTVGVATTTNEPVKATPPEPGAPPVEVVKVEPPPPPAPELPATASAPKPAPAPAPVAQPKAETPAPPPVEVAKTQPAPPVPEMPVTASASTQAPAPAPVTQPKAETSAPPPVEVAKTQPPPPMSEMPATASAPAPAPAPMPVAQPKAETASASEAKPVEPAPVKPEAAPALTPPPPPRPEPATSEEPKPAPAPQVPTVPAPAPSAAHEDAPSAATNSTAAQAAPSAPSPHAARPSSLPTPPVQNATAVPAGTLTLHLNLWIAGLVLAAVAAVSALLLMRRSRAAPQGSLITRSFEREKKP